MGALTAKPTAFNFRTWEVNSMMYVSCQDSLAPSIRVDIYQKKIVRVLPLTDWISDSIRFLFLNLDKQTVKSPAIVFIRKSKFVLNKIKTTLRQHTYVAVMNYLSRRILKKKFDKTNLNIILGSVFTNNIDLYNKLSHKNLNLNFITNQSLITKQKLDLDITKFSEILLLSINPRLDSPLFNLKLKDLETSIKSLGNFQSDFDIISNSIKEIINANDELLLVYSENNKNSHFVKNLTKHQINLTPSYMNYPSFFKEIPLSTELSSVDTINFNFGFNETLNKNKSFNVNFATHIQNLKFDIYIPTTNYFVSQGELITINGEHKLKMIRPSFSLKDHVLALTLMTKNSVKLMSPTNIKIYNLIRKFNNYKIINRLSYFYRQLLSLQKLNTLYNQNGKN